MAIYHVRGGIGNRGAREITPGFIGDPVAGHSDYFGSPISTERSLIWFTPSENIGGLPIARR
jgi:hypothetical protein